MNTENESQVETPEEAPVAAPPPADAPPAAEAEIDLFGEKPPAEWPWMAALEEEMAKGTKISVPSDRMNELFDQHPELKAWAANVRALATKKSQSVSAVLKAAQIEQQKAEQAAKLNISTRESLHRELARVRAIVNDPKLRGLAEPPPKPEKLPDPNSVEGLKYYGRAEVSSVLKQFLDQLESGAKTHLTEIEALNETEKAAQLHQQHVQFFKSHNDAHAYIDEIEVLMDKHQFDLEQAYEVARARALSRGGGTATKAAAPVAANPRAAARAQERAPVQASGSLIPANWDKLTGAQQNALVQRDPRIAEELQKRRG